MRQRMSRVRDETNCSSQPNQAVHKLGERSRSKWHCVTIVMCIAGAIYWNSLGGQFVFDDIRAIENNADVIQDTSLLSVFQHVKK